ncbi:helix-turn-helix domain-containing protein [Salipaludibacillus sp. HK11]|uniref:helix-turn-helix domain-containing protein n=1 Tax=Salipaludibacillus sp. HK11 TaxID=3394320 RepID=UPI0039FCA886
METILTMVPPLPIFIKASSALFPKGEVHFRREFDIFVLLFVTKGTLYMEESGTDIPIGEGEYFILAPYIEHAGSKPCEEDTEFIWVHFTFSSPYSLVEERKIDWSNIIKRKSTFMESDLYNLRLPRFGSFSRKDQPVNLLERLLKINESNEPAERMKQQIYFFDIIIQLQKNALELPSNAQNIATQCIQFIHLHYREDTFRVTNMAHELLYHPDYITRAMKKTIGMSPVQYLNHCRLMKAKELLQQDYVDLKTISNEVGFTDVSYFSRVFKKKEGITPGEYRRTTFANNMKQQK